MGSERTDGSYGYGGDAIWSVGSFDGPIDFRSKSGNQQGNHGQRTDSNSLNINDLRGFGDSRWRNTTPIQRAAHSHCRGIPVRPPDIERDEVRFDEANSRDAQTDQDHHAYRRPDRRGECLCRRHCVLIVDAAHKPDYYRPLKRQPLTSASDLGRGGRTRPTHGVHRHSSAVQGIGITDRGPLGARRHQPAADRGVALRRHEPRQVATRGGGTPATCSVERG